VIDENLGAGLGQSLAVLLKAGQDDEIALIDNVPAMARHVARAGIVLLLGAAALLGLLRRCRGAHQRNDKGS